MLNFNQPTKHDTCVIVFGIMFDEKIFHIMFFLAAKLLKHFFSEVFF